MNYLTSFILSVMGLVCALIGNVSDAHFPFICAGFCMGISFMMWCFVHASKKSKGANITMHSPITVTRTTSSVDHAHTFSGSTHVHHVSNFRSDNTSIDMANLTSMTAMGTLIMGESMPPPSPTSPPVDCGSSASFDSGSCGGSF